MQDPPAKKLRDVTTGLIRQLIPHFSDLQATEFFWCHRHGAFSIFDNYHADHLYETCWHEAYPTDDWTNPARDDDTDIDITADDDDARFLEPMHLGNSIT